MNERDELVDWAVEFYKPHFLEEEPTSEWSMGNYDDVFQDGFDLGAHVVAKRVLEIVEKYALEGGTTEKLVEEMLTVVQEYLLVKAGINKGEFTFSFSETQTRALVLGLVSAAIAVRDCPIPQLPLETMLLEFISTKASDKPSPVQLKEETVEKNPIKKAIHGDESTMGQAVKEETIAETKKEATKEFTEEVGKPSAPGEISIKTVIEKWPEILVDLKPHNHSLVAFLRACRPKEVVGETLVIEVFYKFHRDKLSEQRTREIFEQVVSNVFGVKIRAKFELSEKKPE
jgi:hypothetical protein